MDALEGDLFCELDVKHVNDSADSNYDHNAAGRGGSLERAPMCWFA